ncbi:MAG: RHS repeat-associated core domain-containing protein, partial [Anaerolineae bacterium]|nr:RHS repeat-associated core domain-containing protein [Anaerolineae bacterium]
QETGLYHAKARQYDPKLGRFTTADPFPGVIEVPESLHPYAYAHNAPTVFTDPTGEVAFLGIPLLWWAFAGGASAYFGHTAYQQLAEGRQIYTLDATRGVEAGRAAKWGVAAGATVVSAGTAGLLTTGLLFGGGAGVNVAEQMVLEHRSVGDVDWSSAAFWGGVSTLTGLGSMRAIAAGGRIAQATRLGITGFGAYGAYRGGEMAYEGYQEGDWWKAGLGAAEGTLGLLGAAWGARSFSRAGGFRSLIGPRRNGLWYRNGRELSTAWENVRPRKNRLVNSGSGKAGSANPQVFDPILGQVVPGQWHHPVLAQRHLGLLLRSIGRFLPGATRAIERFGHSQVRLLPPTGHAMADGFAHVPGFTPPWWNRGPVRLWFGLSPVQRVWGAGAAAGVGYGAYRVARPIVEDSLDWLVPPPADVNPLDDEGR